MPSNQIIVFRADSIKFTPTGGSEFDLGRVGSVEQSFEEILGGRNSDGTRKLLGYNFVTKATVKQYSNDDAPALSGCAGKKGLLTIRRSNNLTTGHSNVRCKVDFILDLNGKPTTVKFTFTKVVTIGGLAEVQTPAEGIYKQYEVYNHELLMVSEEPSLTITSATKISDGTSSTGYSALIVTATNHGYNGDKLITTSGLLTYYVGLHIITVVSANSFKFELNAAAASSGMSGSANVVQDSFTLMAQVDSKLTIADVDAGNHDVSLYIRNYLSPSDLLGGDYSFQNHPTFKLKQQTISVPYDNASAALATKGWSITDFVIENSLDLLDGSTYQLFATVTLSAAEVATLISTLES